MASEPDAARAVTLREARAYLAFEAARWPEGRPNCPHCGADGTCRFVAARGGPARTTRTGRPTARRVWRCGSCRRQFSVLTGTLFERTRIPLSAWLAALRILSDPSQSRLQDESNRIALARAAGVCAETAAVMLHLVRAGLAASASG